LLVAHASIFIIDKGTIMPKIKTNCLPQSVLKKKNGNSFIPNSHACHILKKRPETQKIFKEGRVASNSDRRELRLLLPNE
jgi:hypothetical protein